MLPSGGRDALGFTVVVIGPGNSDPYLVHANAIQALGAHFGRTQARENCCP
jgi:hypothetical protein